MDAILTKGASTGETRLVNQCRLFLQFQRLFDICNGAGTKIRRDALSSTLCSTAYTKSSLSWPRQGTPSAKAWLTWRRVIRQTFLTDTQGPLRPYKLRRPLGDWTTPPLNQDTTWKYYYSPIRDTAYERVFHNSYWKFPRIPGRRNGITFASADPDERTQLPATTSPATIITSSMSQITLSTTRRA
jgi:hypothetical protein